MTSLTRISRPRATILAGQLGNLLEATRLTDVSREEHRAPKSWPTSSMCSTETPDVAAVIEALADRLRLLLRTRLVCVLLRREGPFELRAVSAETPQLANSRGARHDRQTIRFAADLAQRAVTAGEAITVSIGSDVHSLGSLVSPGMLIAAPFRTSRTQGRSWSIPGRMAFSLRKKRRWYRPSPGSARSP